MQPGERRALDPADPVLDPETVLRLAGRHVPVASAVLSVDESGGEARSYLLDDGTIFKTQRPHRVRGSTSIEKAAFFMQQLEGVDGVSVPRVLGYGREGTIEYVCESRMPGVAVRYADLDEASKRAMLGDLGRLLRRIHAVEQAPFLASDLMRGQRRGGAAAAHRGRHADHGDVLAASREPELERVGATQSFHPECGQDRAVDIRMGSVSTGDDRVH